LGWPNAAGPLFLLLHESIGVATVTLKLDAHQSQRWRAGRGPKERVDPHEVEWSLDIDLSRRHAPTVGFGIRVGAGGANFDRLKPLPTDLQYGPPDMVASIGGDDASREWKLLDHVAVGHEGELHATLHGLAVLPGADQGNLRLGWGRPRDEGREDCCEDKMRDAAHCTFLSG
jgi:hypothetical protein